MQIQVRKNGIALARLGLIVPKKYLASSVDRNAMKRQIREWFRRAQHSLNGKDVLVRLIGQRLDFRQVAIELTQVDLSA